MADGIDTSGTDEAFEGQLRLADWLAERVGSGGDVEIVDVHRPKGSGYSAETQMFTARYERNGQPHTERLVFRRESPEPAIYPQQAPGLDVEIELQYRTMSALAQHSDVPIAPLIGYESNVDVIGAPFFVMGFVPGVVPVEDPVYTTTGFFVEARPDDRRTMLSNGLRAMAQVHAVDVDRAGLDFLIAPGTTPGTAHQLDVWEQYCRTELRGRQHDLFDEAIEWLRPRLPEDPMLSLCWGDGRPGNIIWNDFQVATLTDFEAASIGSPDQDLGWWLMFDHWVHESRGVDRLPGEPTRDEQRAMYSEHAGRDIGDTTFHEIFAAARYAAIVVRVMNRTVDRGLMPPDHTIWLNNPATVCLDMLMQQVR